MKKPAVFTASSIEHLLEVMQKKIDHLPPVMSEMIILDYGNDPFLILISCLLSLRSRDPVTYAVSKELFVYARTPQEIIALSKQKLEHILRPIGFFHRKAAILKEVSQQLLEDFSGEVPHNKEQLLSIKHVGIKTANLVLSMAFNQLALCVDTHVHRIANHLGLVHTTTPEKTEIELQKIIPQEWWGRINRIFILWGQHICKPNTKRCVCWEHLSNELN